MTRQVTKKTPKPVLYLGTAIPKGADTGLYISTNRKKAEQFSDIAELQQSDSPLYGVDLQENIATTYGALKKEILVNERETQDGGIEHYECGATKAWKSATLNVA